MKIKTKKLVKHAKLPEYAHPTDAGADLFAADNGYKNQDYNYVEYGTGIALELPKNHVGLVFPRSSISKTPHILSNSVGVIDENYRGEIKLRFKNLEDKEHLEYTFGDKIGQLIVIPVAKLQFEEVKELNETDRGTGGFGSTDDSIPLSTEDFLNSVEDLDE